MLASNQVEFQKREFTLRVSESPQIVSRVFLLVARTAGYTMQLMGSIGFVLESGRKFHEHATSCGHVTPSEPNNPDHGDVIPDVSLQKTAR